MELFSGGTVAHMTSTDVKVAVDVSCAARDRVTGWERFTTGVADHTPAIQLRPARTTSSKVGNLAAQLSWYAHGLRSAVRSSGAHLLHAPAYPPPPLDVPVTWTVFDTLVLGDHPQYASKGTRLWSRLGYRALDRVAAVVTYSETVAAEIEAHGVSRDRICVLPAAVTPLVEPSGPPAVVNHMGLPAALPENFALVVGTLSDRKRPDVAAGTARSTGLPVLFVGRRTYEDRDVLAAKPGVFFAGYATDSQLSWCYRNATVLIAPSAYEGIDLPVLEAASVGLPIAASDIGVHTELAASLNVSFFPLDAPSDEVAEVVSLAAATPRSISDVPGWGASAAAHMRCWEQVVAQS